jgi:predicted kinase
MIPNTIIYLIGYAGTGKYTVAKEIAALTNAVIVDNQLINNPIFSVVGADGKKRLPAAVWKNILAIRHIVVETIEELAQPEASFIFTNVLLDRDLDDHLLYQDIENLADKRYALFVPVILRCEQEELCRRVTSPERAKHFKVTCAEKAREKMQMYDILPIEHQNCLDLDITHLSPVQAAQKIITYTEVLRRTHC